MPSSPADALLARNCRINCIELTGGFFSPSLLGWVKTATGSLDHGLYAIAALLTLGALLIAFVVKMDGSGTA